MKTNHPLSPKSARGGFTLIEVLVTMGLASMLIPAVILISSHLTGHAQKGVNFNQAAAQARQFQQFFIRTINSSGKNIRFADDGNTVLFEVYDETAEQWQDASLTYSEKDKTVLYFAPGTDEDFADPVIVADFVHKYNKPVFAASGSQGAVRCTLFSGKQPPGQQTKIAGHYVHPGVFISLSAIPMNKGTYNES